MPTNLYKTTLRSFWLFRYFVLRFCYYCTHTHTRTHSHTGSISWLCNQFILMFYFSFFLSFIASLRSALVSISCVVCLWFRFGLVCFVCFCNYQCHKKLILTQLKSIEFFLLFFFSILLLLLDYCVLILWL